jgi:phasin family protein
MIQVPEQVSAVTKAQVEGAVKFATFGLEATEKFVQFQLAQAKVAFGDAVTTAKGMADMKEPVALPDVKSTMVDPAVEKMTAYAKGLYELSASTQAQFARMVEEHMGMVNKQMLSALDTAAKNGPAGTDLAVSAIKSALAAANSAYDNISKATKQATELAEANLASVTETVKKKAA